MRNNLLNTLKDLGLSENEAAVYLTSLSLGPSTVAKISRDSGVKRTSVYPVIESLKHKGLFNMELKGWKKLYTAESPENLKFIFDNKINKLNSDLPEFMAMYNLKGGESFIKYYEGMTGIQTAYEGMLKDIRPHEDYLITSNAEEWVNANSKFFMDFQERRAKLNINVKMLLQDNKVGREFKKQEKILNCKIKFLPKNTALITNMVVTPKKVLIQQLTPPVFGIVIENKSIIQMNRQLFEIIWNSIKEKNNNKRPPDQDPRHFA